MRVWSRTGRLFGHAKACTHSDYETAERTGCVLTLSRRRKAPKKRASKSGRDFELNTRARMPKIADVLWRFTREVRSIDVSNVKSGSPEFGPNPIPSSGI
jgi:hypothetical protein